MALSVTGGVSVVSGSDGHGYITLDLGVLATGLLTINGSISTFPGGSSIDPGIQSPLIPTVGGGMFDPYLPPILAGIVDPLIGSLGLGPVGAPHEPPPGSTTIVDFGGTILSLPNAFKPH